MRYAEAGLIRTSHIRRPGQTRGVRLFSLTDIERLITDGIEKHPNQTGGPASETNSEA